MKLEIISFVTLLLFTNCVAKKCYKNHVLVQSFPKTEADLNVLRTLDKSYGATFWSMPTSVNNSVEFSLNRLNYERLINGNPRMLNFKFVIRINNLRSTFDTQTIRRYDSPNMETFDWNDYYSVDDINDWMRDLIRLHPNEAQLAYIGQSNQMRNILGLKVELESLDTNRNTVVIEGGCHGNEWISPAFVTYMINAIINSKDSTNDELKLIAKSYVWIFIPVLNPDGYSYSQTQDRLWRKNVRENYGVDLNRNFDIEFGKFGTTTTDKSSPVYCGEAPFSEPETMALKTFLTTKAANVKFYLAIHSYGQNIYIPMTKDFKDVKTYADKVAERSKKKYGIHYSVVVYTTDGYVVSGLSTDWVKTNFSVPYAVTINLPDKGNYGFALPSELILPTCDATLDSLLPFLAPKPFIKPRINKEKTLSAQVLRSISNSPRLSVLPIVFFTVFI